MSEENTIVDPPFVVPELDADDTIPDDRLRKDLKEIKASLKIEFSNVQTSVIVVAIHNEPAKNQVSKIAGRRGTALGGYAYDNLSECYMIRCIDHINLGYLRVGYDVSIIGVAGWKQKIPMPESVLKRYMNQKQLADLKKFKSNYPNCRFEFLQMSRID